MALTGQMTCLLTKLFAGLLGILRGGRHMYDWLLKFFVKICLHVAKYYKHTIIGNFCVKPCGRSRYT